MLASPSGNTETSDDPTGRPQPQFRVKRYGYLVGRYPDFPGQRTAEQVKHLMGEAFAHLKEES